jgi:hypothetical protein
VSNGGCKPEHVALSDLHHKALLDIWLLLISLSHFTSAKLSRLRLHTGSQLLKPSVGLTVTNFQHATFLFWFHMLLRQNKGNVPSSLLNYGYLNNMLEFIYIKFILNYVHYFLDWVVFTFLYMM